MKFQERYQFDFGKDLLGRGGFASVLEDAQRKLRMSDDDLGSGARAFNKYRACYAKAVIARGK